MRVPWRPDLSGPGDAMQFRRASKAHKAPAKPLQNKALNQVAERDNATSLSPCRVAMHSPLAAPTPTRSAQRAAYDDALFEGF